MRYERVEFTDKQRIGRPPVPANVRFADKIVYEPMSGCWLWIGNTLQGGYGLFRVNRKKQALAHRFSYESHVGPIPNGLELDHKCRLRCCVNPDHLEPVTRAENHRRGISDKLQAARAAARTHCPSGHPYSEENTYRHPDGGRVCLTCRRAASRKYGAKIRAL